MNFISNEQYWKKSNEQNWKTSNELYAVNKRARWKLLDDFFLDSMDCPKISESL